MDLKLFISTRFGISSEEADFITSHFSTFYFKKGELVLKQGEVSDAYFYIESGLFRSFLHDVDGNEVTTDFYTPNNVAFEVTSFFTRQPSESNMQAVVDSKGVFISFEKLNFLFHSRPNFRELGRTLLVQAFIQTKQRNYAMINQTAEQRYQQLMATKPEILQLAPLKQIASYLGITDSTLSRIRAKT